MDEDLKSYSGPRPGRLFAAGLIAIAVLIVVLTGGLVLGHGVVMQEQSADLARHFAQGPRVLVEPVAQLASSRVLDLPANVRGYIETPVYAKIPGYLKRIEVDKGDRVTKGELLAVIESPETDKEVADARANYWLQFVTDRRNQELVREAVIAQQTADDSHASMLQAKAAYQQLLAVQAYEIIRAPFDGMITTRYVDPGTLIPQTTTPASGGAPIVAIATLAPLRVYVYVPQELALFIHNGDKAAVSVYERPGRIYSGPIVRHPEAIDSTSRTMLVEIDLPNNDYSLYPGMYARAKLQVSGIDSGVMVRDDSLVFRDGKPYVPVVRGARLYLTPVTLGYDNGQIVQVSGDVRPSDLVALNVGQSVSDGETVRPMLMQKQ